MIESEATVACTADGFAFEAPAGQSLMQALVATGFDIEAACEGNLVCATCHVVLDGASFARVGPPGAEERSMLATLIDATPTSRLSCQIRLAPGLDGLVLAIPR